MLDDGSRAERKHLPPTAVPPSGFIRRLPGIQQRIGISTTWLLALLIGFFALVPRTAGLNDFFTIDEGYHWRERVERFSQALAAGDWAKTNQTGHPGVTTMWLGSLGRQLALVRGISDPGWAGGGAEYLGMLRLPLAIANALAAVAGFLLLRRLFPLSVAILAGILWATSPFLIAHSRLLHLDALLTSFVTLSVLLLLVALSQEPRTKNQVWQNCRTAEPRNQEPGAANQRKPTPNSGNISELPATSHQLSATRQPSSIVHRPLSTSYPFLIASALVGGLALLTKAPSLILLPFVGLAIAGYALWPATRALLDNNQPTTTIDHPEVDTESSIVHRPSSIVHRLLFIVRTYLLWLASAALIVLLLWPALWVSPLAAIGDVIGEIILNGGQPHHSGNYFLGQPVGDPGALFYPMVVLLRTTPLTLIGLAFSLITAIAALLRRDRSSHAQYRPATVALLAFVLLFGLLMSVEAKKLDRYLLPIWPALDILAAIGLAQAGRWLASRLPVLRRRGVGAIAIGLAAVVGSATCFVYQPYYLSFYNPLLGGGPTAERVMLVGIGEGMDQVGAWLRERPDLDRGDVLSWIPPTLAPFVPKEILVRDLRPEFLAHTSSYAVLYIRSVQHKESAEAEAAVRANPPLYTVMLHGVPYATIHQLPRPYDTPVGAVFDGSIHLRGYSQQRIDSTLVITPSWGITQSRPGGAFVFLHLLDSQGNRVAQVDAPLDQGMFAAWQLGQQFNEAFPLALPAELAPGTYRIVLGVYQPQGARFAVTQGNALPESIDGPQVIELGEFIR